MSDEVVFTPAPGWPAPPPNWQPRAGWQPDPAWPAAPAGWVFYRTPDGAPAATPAGGWEPPSAPAAYLPGPTAPSPLPMPPTGTMAPGVLGTATADVPADPYAAGAAVPPAAADPYASGTAPVMAGGTRAPDGTWTPAPVPAPTPSKGAKAFSLIRLIIALVVVAVAAGVAFYTGYWSQRYTSPLNQAQFLTLINKKMPADFGPVQFESNVRMSDVFYDDTTGDSCAAYSALDGDNAMSSAGIFPDALGTNLFFLANFDKRADAEKVTAATKDCLSQIGFTAITETTSTNAGVGTWTFTATPPDGSAAYTFNLAVFHNILAYAEQADPAKWTAFVSTTFPQAVNAARK